MYEKALELRPGDRELCLDYLRVIKQYNLGEVQPRNFEHVTGSVSQPKLLASLVPKLADQFRNNQAEKQKMLDAIMSEQLISEPELIEMLSHTPVET